MSRNLAQYTAAVREAEANFKTKLGSGRASVGDVAVARRTWETMVAQLREAPDSVLAYERMPADPRTGLRGADRWLTDTYRRANDELFPHLASQASQDAYARKFQEYLDLGVQIVRSPDMRQRVVIDRQNGRSYLYQENPVIPRIMQVIATELMLWFERHPITPAFLAQSARAGLADFLVERPDMVALLRLAQMLPLDFEISDVPIERPLVVEALELVIGVTPIAGNLVAAYEAYAGRDLFGYRLTDVERGVLAATVLLPLAGRLVKGGRILYTETRLVALYGRDAAAWSRTMAASGRATGGPGLRALERAEAAVRAQQRLAGTLAREAANSLPALVRGPAAASAALDQAVLDLFQELSRQHSVLSSLDGFALRRILEKGPNVDHLKGQLLEELLESRLVPWLRDRAGSFALGLQVPTGKQLEFIPGHLIRDLAGRQITDGILAVRNDGVLEILAVFEAKAGRRAARELSLSRSSISSLTPAERAELRAYARDVLRERRAEAQLAGTPFQQTIEEVEREVALSELGGQVRRDIERLADGATIRVGAGTTPVRISPTRTKFFGVLPRDVNPSLIERELRDGGFNFEIVGVDINQRDLRTIADRLRPAAEQLTTSP
ncbi:hypothetical protein GGE65_007856 [Skermanella aerolata]|uniref:pre-toxin TG domain-containing protein n=1 Tax=Skermanella aerolata TaxID=393310 RepID=UPI003D20568D